MEIFYKRWKEILFLLFLFDLALLIDTFPEIVVLLTNTKIMEIFWSWDKLSTEEKKILFLEENQKLLNENKNISEEEKEQIMENYKNMVEKYINYLSRFDFIETMTSSKNVQIKYFDGQLWQMKNGDNITTYKLQGYAVDDTIYYDKKNMDTLAHEKYHTDSSILAKTPEKRLMEEVKCSLMAKHGYNQECILYSLIGEIIGKEQTLNSIFKNDPDMIWENLNHIDENVSQMLRKEIAFYCEKMAQKDPNFDIKESKQKIQSYYQELFEKNKGYSIEKDAITYSQMLMFLNILPVNWNNIFYDETYEIIPNLPINENERYKNFSELLIEKGMENSKNYPFLCLFLYEYCPNYENAKDYNTYLEDYLNQEKLSEILYNVINCNSLEEYELITEEIHTIYYDENNLERKRKK